MQFLVRFPTLSVPLHLQLCIKPAQKTSVAEEYRNYLDTSTDEHLNSVQAFCVEVLLLENVLPLACIGYPSGRSTPA